MKDSNVTILIPMAGLGTRFKNEGFELPKPLIKVNGKTLIEHSVTSLGIKGNYIFITRKYENPNENILLSKKLKELSPNCIEITLQSPTRGAVETCLFAEKFINNDEPLIITNCDQITDWTPEEFENFINDDELDGSIVTYTSVNPKNSFAIVNNGIVQKLVEKNQVSDIALIGLHQWKKGKDFVESAKNLQSLLKSDLDKYNKIEKDITSAKQKLKDLGLENQSKDLDAILAKANKNKTDLNRILSFKF